MFVIDDGDVRIAQGDALEQLRLMGDGIAQCIVTSPPFWGLRDYGTAVWVGGDPDCDHRKNPPLPPQHRGSSTLQAGFANQNAAKDVQDVFRDVCGKCSATSVDGQIGMEQTPDAWCASLVEVFRECRRVLRDDGVMWLEVGDTYHGGGYSNHAINGPVYQAEVGDKRRDRQQKRIDANPDIKPKDLVGAPWMLAMALRADGWFLRSDVIWNRPNPMPESVTDRPTKAHSYVFLLSKSPRYFFDADAIREEAQYGRRDWSSVNFKGGDIAKGHGGGTVSGADASAGRNARSVWTIATECTPFAHFATFPQALVERCIAAGTSDHGCCVECGTPWERVREQREQEPRDTSALKTNQLNTSRNTPELEVARRKGSTSLSNNPRMRPLPPATIGWEQACRCDTYGRDPVPCVVLDPFMGSGTTALVARRMGRHSIGVELSPAYIDISRKRLQQLSLFGDAA